MSDLIWTIDDGLHEITPGEAREEAGKLLRRARYERDPVYERRPRDACRAPAAEGQDEG
jgi:hypothetical protein